MKTQAISVYGVWLDDQGRVLLIKDVSSHLWGFPGGGIEAAETHAQTLQREFLEETGLRIRGTLTYLINQDDSRKQRYFYQIHAAEGSLAATGNTRDIAQAGYFALDRLPLQSLVPGMQDVIASLPEAR